MLWFVIFMTDIVLDAFLRPGGRLKFLQQDLVEYSDNNDTLMANIRKYLQIN